MLDRWTDRVPTLQGDLTSLREVAASDVYTLFTLFSDPAVTAYMAPPPPTLAKFAGFVEWSHQQRAQGHGVCFGIVPDGMTAAVGILQVRLEPTLSNAEWGVVLSTHFWSTGLFADATNLLMEFAFTTMHVERLEARIALRNRRALAAVQKLGARFETTLAGSSPQGIARDPESVWTLREHDWRNRAHDPHLMAHDAAQRIRTAVEAAESELRRSEAPEAVEPYPLFLFDRRRRDAASGLRAIQSRVAFGSSRLLGASAERQLVEVRQQLADLRDILVALPATDPDLATLSASVRQLDELFMIVVVGEFNAGKSAFVNALLGERIFEEGVTPTTARIQLIRYGATAASSHDDRGALIVTAPVELLHDLQIVDTPGTNALNREHERLTREFVPRADLVVFVTSADRPFTESERAFLETIRDWGKKIVIVVNKVDILENKDQIAQVLTFVDEAASRLLGVTPERFAVSARRAWRAKHGDPEQWAASGFGPLETFLLETLDNEERFRLKLASPLGVGSSLAARYETFAADRLSVLSADVESLDATTRQLSLYGEDLEHGFELRMTAVEKALVDMESRGQSFLDDTLRIGRVFDLMNRPRVQREFEERVIADAPADVERRVSELIDWLVDQDLRQWQALSSRLTQRRQAHGEHMTGEEIGGFRNDRAALLDSVGRQAQRVVKTFDRRVEAQALADGARTAVAATAAVGASALGLGALVTVVATTAAADVSGVLAAGVLGAVGMLILPAKRRRARAELEAKIADLRQRLTAALRSEFEAARDRSVQRLTDSIGPYSRFVRAEQTKWTDARTALERWRTREAAERGANRR